MNGTKTRITEFATSNFHFSYFFQDSFEIFYVQLKALSQQKFDAIWSVADDFTSLRRCIPLGRPLAPTESPNKLAKIRRIRNQISTGISMTLQVTASRGFNNLWQAGFEWFAAPWSVSWMRLLGFSCFMWWFRFEEANVIVWSRWRRGRSSRF